MIKKLAIGITLGLLLVFGPSAVAVSAQDDDPPGWDWGRRNPVLNQVADILGVEAADLKTELDSGKTILEIAQAKGFTLDDLLTKLSATMQERMKTAVDNAKLTQSEADERIASMKECLTAYLKGEDTQCDAHFMSRNLPFAMGRMARSPLNKLENLAEKLNMKVEDLKAALEGGKTIPEIAESQGITLEDLKADREEALIERVNQAVENGNLTQAEADEIIAWIKARPESTWFDKMSHRKMGGRHPLMRKWFR